jgi:hypothetical protein
MYIREIPDEFREEIKIIVANMQMLPKPAELQRLFYFYYRYVKKLQRGENMLKRMQKDLSCPACKGKVLYYFKNIVNEW